VETISQNINNNSSIILWCIVDVLGDIRDEYSNIVLAATVFKAIVYNTMRIFISTLFDSTTLLFDVTTLLTLQYFLALCGDVHPNPGPCKSKKLKTNNRTNTETTPINTNGESAKILWYFHQPPKLECQRTRTE
jgi:hypothetical protein